MRRQEVEVGVLINVTVTHTEKNSLHHRPVNTHTHSHK